jgi:hypothetical protein
LQGQSLVLRAIGGESPVTQEAVLVTRNRFRAIGDGFPVIGGEFPVTQKAIFTSTSVFECLGSRLRPFGAVTPIVPSCEAGM